MHALILAAALAAAAPSNGKTTDSADACKPPQIARAASRDAQGPRKLTELPDARLTRLVIRTVGECYVSEVRTATGEWRYEPAGKAPDGLMRPNPNPFIERLR
jgi:hypothetical protein